MDIPVHPFSLEQLLAAIETCLKQNQGLVVLSLNPEIIMALQKNKALADFFKSNPCNIPDGDGLVWALRKIFKKKFDRLAGVDLLEKLFQKGGKFYFLGGSPQKTRQIQNLVTQRFPQVEWVGGRDGYFSWQEADSIAAEIQACAAGYVLVGMGFPRQDKFVSQFPQIAADKVVLTVGGSLDVLSGLKKRAPRFLQKMHLEWFYRLLQEPKRIGRMAVLPVFVYKILKFRGSDILAP